MRKVIVTGGLGFIGINLIRKLLLKKFHILNIDKISYCSTNDNYLPFKDYQNYKFKKLNLTNTKILKNVISNFKPDFILNLAANSHVDRSIDNPLKFINENIYSTSSLLEAVRTSISKNFIRFIHISTDEIYGGDNKLPSKENNRFDTSSPYSASKASTNLICNSYSKTFNIPISIINCCNNYGPYQFTEKFIPTIISKIIKNERIPIYGKGNNIREWIYVDDFCDAILSLLNKNDKEIITFNVGSKERISNLHLVNKIISICNHIRDKKYDLSPKFVLDRPGHDFIYHLNSSLFRNSLNWQHKINLEKGLTMTIKWYFDNSIWLKRAQKKYHGERLGNK
tara:strand:+ start:7183 stop:8202 length:1020 start_codon:yes stop_codon:yes gene_type:complete